MTEPAPTSHLQWCHSPSTCEPEIPWLCAVDEDGGHVLALIHPAAETPVHDASQNEQDSLRPVERLCAWRLLTFALSDEDPSEHIPEQLRDELTPYRQTIIMALRGDQATIARFTCQQAFDAVPQEHHRWIEHVTETALNDLAHELRGPAAEIITGAALAFMARNVADVQSLLAEWEQCGGRERLLRRVLDDIDQRRGRIIDLLTEQPEGARDWNVLLRDRLIDVVAAFTEDTTLDHEGADYIAWTAAIALQASVEIAAAAPGDFSFESFLATAHNTLVVELEGDHEDEQEWLICCARLTGALRDGPFTADEASKASAELLKVHAHLIGAILAAGRADCVVDPEHTEDDE